MGGRFKMVLPLKTWKKLQNANRVFSNGKFGQKSSLITTEAHIFCFTLSIQCNQQDPKIPFYVAGSAEKLLQNLKVSTNTQIMWILIEHLPLFCSVFD